MLEVKIDSPSGIIVVEPKGPLESNDFENMSIIVDSYLKKKGKLHGIMIRAAEFPGWNSFGALVEHIRFVHDHHRQIEKVALITDSPIGKLAPILSKHFVNAEVRHFNSSAFDEANCWLTVR